MPNVGKSTLFNAITNSEVEAANYPFATINPNVGVVEIMDERVQFLDSIYNSKKLIYNQIQFVDIAGLVSGASKGEGLGNKFLSNIREVNAIVHVVRLFVNDEIVHVNGVVDPINDINTIDLELILSDIEQIDRWIQKNGRKALNSKEDKNLLILMEDLKNKLSNEHKLNEFSFSEKELKFLEQFQFLTMKPTIYLANVGEDEISNYEKNPHYIKFKEKIEQRNEQFLIISAQIEYEISKLDDEEQQLFLQELNLKQKGLDSVSKMAFQSLGLGTYFTAGPEEIHAWEFKKGISAPEAAGIIHTDFEKGFIKAEIFSFKDFQKYPSEHKLKEKGLLRLEGKDYIIQDGDICHFRFNL